MMPRLVKLIYDRFYNRCSSEQGLVRPCNGAGRQRGRFSPGSDTTGDLSEAEIVDGVSRTHLHETIRMKQGTPSSLQGGSDMRHTVNIEMV